MNNPGQTNSPAAKAWYRRWWAIVLWVFLSLVLAFLAALGFYIFDQAGKIRRGEISSPAKPGLDYQEGENNYWFGTSTPELTIVEFSDFACPHSRSSYQTIRQFGLKYQDRVKIVYRDFPNISEQSPELALAARCAGQQGKFWPMHDKLFQNQGASGREDLARLAAQAGANAAQFSRCFESKAELAAVQANLTAGERLGVAGTPTWFINGQKVEGDLPAEIWEKIIADLLK